MIIWRRNYNTIDVSSDRAEETFNENRKRAWHW